MAEVYWDMEWTLQQQGFDYAYDINGCTTGSVTVTRGLSANTSTRGSIISASWPGSWKTMMSHERRRRLRRAFTKPRPSSRFFTWVAVLSPR